VAWKTACTCRASVGTRQVMVWKSLQSKQRLRTGYRKMVDVLRHREFPADCYAQHLDFLDSFDGWNHRRRDQHSSTSASWWHKNDLHRLDVIQAKLFELASDTESTIDERWVFRLVLIETRVRISRSEMRWEEIPERWACITKSTRSFVCLFCLLGKYDVKTQPPLFKIPILRN